MNNKNRRINRLLSRLAVGLMLAAMALFTGCPNKITVKPETFAVTFSAGEHGTLKAKADSVTETDKSPISVEKDKTVVFTAVPEKGYEVEKWTVNGTAVANNVSTTYSHKVTAAVTVKVSFKALPPSVVAVTDVTLNKSELTLEAGKSEKLTATVLPDNATNKTVTWSSNKPDVAAVDKDGKVTAHKAGEATLTVTTTDGGKTASCKVNVTAKALPPAAVAVTGVTLDKPTVSFVAGTSTTLTATVLPANATNKTVTWSSDKPAIASVDKNGTVTAHKAGEAVITVKSEDGGKTASCKVTVSLTEYAITYHLDGGSNHADNPAKYTVETETIPLKDAAKANYRFAGWYANAGCSGEKVTEIGKGCTGNKELWAKWEAVTYSIIYHLNGGSHSGNPASYTVETETITLKAATKTGYSFMGWYEKADFSGEKVTEIGKGSTGNKELWAKWEAITYSIIYHLNGGSHSGNPASYTVETETITLKDAERTGYTFMGWYANAGCSGEKVTQIAQGRTGDKALWAKWEMTTYSITYNLNGGSHSGNPVSYTVETETITLKDAATANYIFAGWYEKADFTGEKVTEIRKGSSGNKELYAKFIEIKMIDIAAVTNGTVGHSGVDNNGVHIVSLTAYRIGESEVTQELWQAVMGNNPSRFKGAENPPDGSEVQEKRPVESVNWYECIAFCNELTKQAGLGESECLYYSDAGYTKVYTKEDAGANKEVHLYTAMDKKGFRLPTEAEWEWAAKGGTEDKWAGTDEGSELVNYAWYSANSNDKTHEVKKKQANGYGLYDMSGNVWEWCWDRYSSSAHPTGGQDPTGAVSGFARVNRGGSWYYDADHVARAYRDYYAPHISGNNLGLRVVCRP